jgi:hypothetical protein
MRPRWRSSLPLPRHHKGSRANLSSTGTIRSVERHSEGPAGGIGRRQWLISTGIGLVGVGFTAYGVLRPAPPVQVIVQVPPQPAPATIPIESGAYVANLSGTITMTLSLTGSLSATPPDLV